MTDWPAGARAFVEAARVARMATTDHASIPHVIPVCFVLAGERLYTIVDHKPKRRPTALKRLRNIADNPSVAIVVDRWDEDWSRLAWVMMQGRAQVVADDADYAAAVSALRAKYAQYAAVTFARATHPLIAVRIEHVIAWRGANASY